jgi:3-oxo-5-alpha-steroid 4-dehydrogenase 3 / polyprenol reductase
MTLMVYLSYGVPLLRALASHGKTRGSSIPPPAAAAVGSRQQQMKTATTTTTILRSFLDGELFWIRKKRFSQFYFVGIAWLTLFVWFATDGPQQHSAMALRPSTALLYLHLVRRLYECLYVHQWRESSRMHVAGYAVGLIHYLWLPTVFITLPRCRHYTWSSSSSMFLGAPAILLPWLFDHGGDDALQTSASQHSLWRRLPAILFCISAQWQQHRHHVYLAELRPQPQQQRVEPTMKKKTKSSSSYTLPSKGWFTVITCPHYLAEILIYTAFALVLAQEGKAGYRHWVVLAWVASNLTLSAIMNHSWYKTNLPSTATVGKTAIVPFLI